jgi:acetate kinase
MSTRSGDLDPGVLVYLLLEKRMTGEQIDDYVNHQAGLLGVSQLSADVEDLLAAEASNPQAAEALELFCYQARKYVGALAAALGGLDTLIFTAGIGENAPVIRARICEGLAFLGVRLDAERNEANAAVISPEGAPVMVRVMKTNEELMIVRHTARVIGEGSTEP